LHNRQEIAGQPPRTDAFKYSPRLVAPKTLNHRK
jgi:hypothetical protein